MLFVIFPLLLLIFYLPLIFASLITVCLSVFLLGFILPGTVCVSWTWLTISFCILGKFSENFQGNQDNQLFKYFLRFFFYSPSGIPIMQLLVCLMLSQRSLRLSSFLFILFSIFCSVAGISTILSSRSFICSSASVILLWIPYSVLFIFACLFFSSSRSLVNISCIFSVSAFILFLNHYSEIIHYHSCKSFISIIMNSFSGMLPISTSFSVLGFYPVPSARA